MVLTKEELIGKLDQEVRILLHLASKVDPSQLDFRPTAGQRSLLELLQYLTAFVPIHLGTIAEGAFNMDSWSSAWHAEEALAKERTLDDIKEALAKQRVLFAEMLGPLSDDDLRAEISLFGSKASKGSWLVSLVLCHYAAYRMQLFLYLKSCGREELGTLDLWVGIDAAAAGRGAQ